MAYIKVIQPEEAEGRLSEIYNDIKDKRGGIADVHKIQSLNPESIMDHMKLYMTIMFGKSPIKRVVREMMAVITSKHNNCNYCISHHIEAVNHYWKDDEKCKKFLEDYTNPELGLSNIELELCSFAEMLTVNKGDYSSKTTQMRSAGLEDKAILDASLVISYFNFVNRLVLSLGVQEESGGVGGYKYD